MGREREPVRRGWAGGRARPGADDAARGAPRAARGDPRASCASTTLPPGSRACWPISTAAPRYGSRLVRAMSRSAQAGELRSVNPATLEPVGSVPASAPGEVAEAVVDARLAAERWAGSSFAERRALLGRVASALLDAADEIAATVTAETGKPLVESYTAELFVALDNLVWAASNAGRVLAQEPVRFGQPHLRHKRGVLLYEPLGVIGVISPWNFPFGIPLSQAAFAVAAGNAVVVKPSEVTPLSGAWVQRVFREAGAPKRLVQVVQGGAEAGEALVRAPGTAKVVFTGSAETGRRVASLAGERLRPVTLELGGKDPMLVFEDADLDRAVGGRALGQLLQLRPGVLGRRADLRGAAAPGAVRRGADPPRACAPDRSRRGARDRARAADLRAPARARRGAGLGRARSRRGAAARRRAPGHRPSGLVLRADDPDRRRSRGAGPARGDLRAGRHGLAVRGRGRGGAARERLELRPRRKRLDARPREGQTARAPAGCGLGLDERRLVLLRRGPGLVGRDEGIGLRAHTLEARPLRALAGQVRRPRPRALAGGVVVSVQRGRSWTASAGWRECSIARGWGRRFRRRGGTGAGSSRSDGGTFRADE